MQVLVATEHHFLRTPDGQVYSRRGRPYQFWGRYLDVFDEVVVVARVERREAPTPSCVVSSGPNVRFVDLPMYHGPLQYLARLGELKSQMRVSCSQKGAVIARLPGPIATLLLKELRRDPAPYGVEVIGDPWDVFSRGAVRHPLRPFFRWYFSSRLRDQCSKACGAAYVTEHRLQRRYPPPPNGFSAHFSSIDLSDAALVSTARPVRGNGDPFTVVTVSGMSHLYKAQDVLIDAVGDCLRQGFELQLVLVGGGEYRAEMEARAAASGFPERYRFMGEVPAGDPVRAQLDRADLFVLASRQEGLPRAMIEAMARGLPCIGSTVGGIPELLPPEDLVPPNDVEALARKIREVLADPQRMAQMSARNLAKAAEYRDDVLRGRRVAFYRHLREVTETWLRERQHGRAETL